MTLDERLAAGRLPQARPVPPAAANPIEPWIRAVAGGDHGAFRRRLCWDGLEEPEVVALLSRPVPFPKGSLPPWTETLAAALERSAEVLEALHVKRPLPELARFAPAQMPRFAELWVPFVRLARERLRASAGRTLDLLAPDAVVDLESALLAQTAWFAELTLYELFSAYRRDRIFSRSEENPGPAPSRHLYRQFVASLLSGGLVGLFLESSALARQICRLADNWVEAGAELLGRLDADRQELETLFGALGVVTEIHTGLSDRHAGGRTVLVLRFATGSKVVYKPRTIGLEAAWNAFLSCLSEHGGEPLLRTMRLLEREGYGFTEFLEPADLESEAQAAEYFRKAGALLCFSWILGSSDLHMDNIIATADGPVVIDAELALQPELEAKADSRRARGAAFRAGERLNRSFLRSGLLTMPQLDANGRSIDIGGLRGTGGHVATLKKRTFTNPNTDEMELTFETALASPMQNVPTLEGKKLLPDDYALPLTEGFVAMYRFLLAHRDAIVASGGPLNQFAGRATRFVFRPSDLYARLLFELSAPAYLREGVIRSFALDSINRVFLNASERPPLWPLTPEERTSLEDFDIPYFSVDTGSQLLRARSGEVIEGFLRVSGLDAARERLRQMSEEDLAEQRSLLLAHLFPVLEPAAQDGPAQEGTRGHADHWVRLAEEIGEEIRSHAIEGDDGGIAWATPKTLREPGAEEPLASFSLYDGAVGIALFFSALGAATGRDLFRQAARAACRPLLTAFDAPNVQSLLRREGIGGGQGLGSLVYGLSVMGRVLSDDWFFELAIRAAAHVTPDRVQADRRLDVQGGAAGSILGLLALYRLTGHPEALETASRCGEHLLSQRRELGEGRWGWPDSNGLCLAGLAHGAAGIALALARLSAATGRADFGQAAANACRYERGLFNRERGNWPVLTRDGAGEEGQIFMMAWCHGAPGIGLSRLGLLPWHDSEELRADLDESIRATRRTGILSTDHLCCGNAGLVETLLAAGEELGRPDLIAEARARAAVFVHRSVSRGAFRFRVSGAEEADLEPSFFRGLSGLGYTLLRVASPGNLPSVLLFADTPRATREEKRAADRIGRSPKAPEGS